MEPTEQNLPESIQPPTIHAATEHAATDIAQSLEEAEEMLKAVKERYTQVQAAKTRQPELEAHMQALNAELETARRQQPESEVRLQELKAELETVKGQLAQTWEDLESQLITWRDKEELFWQFLRFAGIGFALAMLINYFVK
jgi:chromosome segregation ATPase